MSRNNTKYWSCTPNNDAYVCYYCYYWKIFGFAIYNGHYFIKPCVLYIAPWQTKILCFDISYKLVGSDKMMEDTDYIYYNTYYTQRFHALHLLDVENCDVWKTISTINRFVDVFK